MPLPLFAHAISHLSLRTTKLAIRTHDPLFVSSKVGGRLTAARPEPCGGHRLTDGLHHFLTSRVQYARHVHQGRADGALSRAQQARMPARCCARCMRTHRLRRWGTLVL